MFIYLVHYLGAIYTFQARSEPAFRELWAKLTARDKLPNTSYRVDVHHVTSGLEGELTKMRTFFLYPEE